MSTALPRLELTSKGAHTYWFCDQRILKPKPLTLPDYWLKLPREILQLLLLYVPYHPLLWHLAAYYPAVCKILKQPSYWKEKILELGETDYDGLKGMLSWKRYEYLWYLQSHNERQWYLKTYFPHTEEDIAMDDDRVELLKWDRPLYMYRGYRTLVHMATFDLAQAIHNVLCRFDRKDHIECFLKAHDSPEMREVIKKIDYGVRFPSVLNRYR